MTKTDDILAKTIEHALTGEGAHAGAHGVFEGLDWTLAGERPGGAPHSLFELVKHLAYWQDWVVKWLEGKTPPVPKHASGSWPSESKPSTWREWERAVSEFQRGLDALERAARGADLLEKRGKKTRLEMLHTIASHNSYHVGQAAMLRQMLGAWPPPGGGVTW